MRVAAIYDIHGNLPALEAVLTEIEQDGVDLIVVGGDVAAGPMPGATIDRLMSLGPRARFVRGNADREMVAAWDRQAGSPDLGTASPLERISAWAAGHLTRAQRDFLASFDEQVVITINGLGTVRFCHGSPRGDEEVITVATPGTRLRAILTGVTDDVVVCGHTHMQFDRWQHGTRVVNAGSVGMPYEGVPGAYWVVLGPGVEFRRTPYDAERAAEQIRATGFPGVEEFVRGNILAPPFPIEAVTVFEGRSGTASAGG
ncbi:MAG: metallophosphoesterase family protein [Sphaerobacter thermophilus]|uniref:Metallophosphoesterase n=1 Tax=Sphaerobacter thermophilus (strain ATCC 49802 / DSM 20745 / KCCM 41009 / NCIMB 13125 / S 6022) TaxID=479434 RepID=D1C752_SPHTD|nr:metallophosphoesterase family protein [Sphaerobacter thermophilus]ACZ39698.1 metallophosphoesterase [Sphaerobacter thermophilus DSM 20745]PZN61416.1 MAG: metallophosphoesterase [Sphaerobacter thermophilus]